MKFTIRDLFLVTLVVALAVAWWVDRSTLANKVEELDREIEANKSPLHLPPMPNSHASAPNPP